MMMQLLAEASTIDAGAVVQIISTLVGAGAIGGGGYVMGKARKISLSNDPLNVRKANEYATKEDIARLEREIRDIKNDRKEDLGDLAGSSDYEILYQVEDVVRKALQDGQVDKGERAQLASQLKMLLGNDRGQDETPAIHGMVELVREILGRYSRSQETAQKLNAEVAELKSRLNKIDSQRGYGH